MSGTKLTRDHHLWTRDTIKNVSGDVTLDLAGDLTIEPDGGDVNITAAGTEKPALVLKNTVDSNKPSLIKFFKDRASTTAADNDIIGTINWASMNDADQDTAYATMIVKAMDVSDGSEDGKLSISVRSGGNLISEVFNLEGTTSSQLLSDLFTIKSDTASSPTLKLHSTSDHGSGAYLEFHKARGAAGQDSDNIGVLSFTGYNDAGTPEEIEYIQILGTISDASDSNEGGKLEFKIATHDGELQSGLTLADGDAEDEIDVSIASGTSSMTSVAGHLSLVDNSKLYLGTSGDNDYITSDGDNILVKKNDTTVMQIEDTHLQVPMRQTTFSSTAAISPTITIKNEYNDEFSSILKFVKDRGAGGQDNDSIGKIEFQGKDDGSGWTTFATIESTISDASAGAEGGKLSLSVASHDAESVAGLVLTDGSGEDEIDVTIASGEASITTVAGKLQPQGQLNMAQDEHLTLGQIDDYIYGDGTNVHISKDDSDVMTFFDTVVRTLVDAEFSGDITAVNASSTKPIITLKNTTNDAHGSSIKFLKDKGAAASDGDTVGSITFYGDNDAQQETLYGSIAVTIPDASDGAEEGMMQFNVASHDGESQPGLKLQSGDAEDEVDVVLGNGSASTTSISGMAQLAEISSPSAPSDGAGGFLYTKTDGKPYWISNEVSETDLSASGGGGSSSYHWSLGARARCQYNNWFWACHITYGWNYYYYFYSTGASSLPSTYPDSYAPGFIVPVDSTVTGYNIVGNPSTGDTWEFAIMKGAQPTFGSAGDWTLSQIGSTQSAGGFSLRLYKWEETGLSVAVSKNDMIMPVFRRTTDNDTSLAYNEFSMNVTLSPS